MSKITEREKEILKIIHSDPMISQEDLAEMVGITRSAIAVHISNLIKKGFILGRGYVINDRTGVLVLGSTYVEVTASCNAAGNDDFAQIDIAPGGAAYTMALHLASQRIPTALMTALGRDDWGELIKDRLQKSQVDTRYLLIQKDFPTSRLVSLLDTQDTCTRKVADRRALELLTAEQIQGMGVTVANCRMLVVDSAINSNTLKFVLDLAREVGVPVCLKFSGDDLPDLGPEDLQGVYLGVMSGRLAEKLTGMKVRDLDDCVDAGKALNRQGIEIAVIILPEYGVALTGSDDTVAVPILPVQELGVRVKSSELSGQVLTAGLVSGILHGYDFRQAVRLAIGMTFQRITKSRNLSELQEKQQMM